MVSGAKATDFVSQNCRISSSPAAVRSGPTVRVAFGAHRLIIWSMSFIVMAWWNCSLDPTDLIRVGLHL